MTNDLGSRRIRSLTLTDFGATVAIPIPELAFPRTRGRNLERPPSKVWHSFIKIKQIIKVSRRRVEPL